MHDHYVSFIQLISGARLFSQASRPTCRSTWCGAWCLPRRLREGQPLPPLHPSPPPPPPPSHSVASPCSVLSQGSARSSRTPSGTTPSPPQVSGRHMRRSDYALIHHMPHDWRASTVITLMRIQSTTAARRWNGQWIPPADVGLSGHDFEGGGLMRPCYYADVCLNHPGLLCWQARVPA
jgi:hypothetical protein